VRERLSSVLSEKVFRYLFGPSIEKNRSFYNMIDVMKAQFSMLISEGIVDDETGKKMMRSLNEIREEGRGQNEIDPPLEDLYFQIEQQFIDKAGIKIAGQLHTGKSRKELYATVMRMNSRDGIKRLCVLLLMLRYTLLEFSDQHSHTVFTGYTHMQPAEPITLGHYVSAILHAMERDFARLRRALQQTNLSPMGSGEAASREKTSRLLGFADAMDNSLDGVASGDYILEALSAMNILMNHISRLIYDLYIWSADEFEMAETGDSAAAASSLMQQKKNPVALEHIKAKSSHVLAALVSATGCMGNLPYGYFRDMAGECTKLFWDSLHEVEAALVLLLETVQTMDFKEKKMPDKSSRNFSAVTELADLLVREARISFRKAHQIIGFIVNDMLQRNMELSQLNSRVIEKSSKEVLGKGIFISEEKN